MSRYRTIMYMVDKDTGFVWSQVDGVYAIPVLDFEGMKPENSFHMHYNLEKVQSCDVGGSLHVIHTRKIPVELKNIHRAFWGMPPLSTKKGINEHNEKNNRS